MNAQLPQFPVFVMCGRDPVRPALLDELDPAGEIPSKALLPLLGRRVLDWQLDALARSPYVSTLTLIGLDPAATPFAAPAQTAPTPLTAPFTDKLQAGLDTLHRQGQDPALVVVSSSDAPAVHVEGVNAFMAGLARWPGVDFAVGLVPEQVMEDAFPQCRRAVARFRDHQVCAGELMAFSQRAIVSGRAIIKEVGQRRHRVDRQAARIPLTPMLGYLARTPRIWPLLLKFLLKRATLHDAERALSLAFSGRVKGIIVPDAGFGMDIDLPGDYERVRDYMLQTGIRPPAGARRAHERR